MLAGDSAAAKLLMLAILAADERHESATGRPAQCENAAKSETMAVSAEKPVPALGNAAL